MDQAVEFSGKTPAVTVRITDRHGGNPGLLRGHIGTAIADFPSCRKGFYKSYLAEKLQSRLQLQRGDTSSLGYMP